VISGMKIRSLILLFSIAVFVFLGANTLAQDYSWLGNKDLPYKKTQETFIPKGSDTPAEYANTYSQPNCTNMQFTVKPGRYFISSKLVIQNEIVKDVCAVEVGGGFYGNGYYLKHGTNVAGKVHTTLSGHSPYIVPLERSNSFIEFDYRNPNYYVRIVNNGWQTAEPDGSWWSGELKYTLTSHTSTIATKNNGQAVKFRAQGHSVASNNRWLVAEAPNDGVYRIDLQNGQAKKFMGKLLDGVSLPLIDTAVSNDGNNVAVASGRMTFFNLYDLNNCNNVGICQFRDIRAYLRTKENFSSAYKLSFKGQNLRFVGVFDINTDGRSLAYYTVAPPGQDVDTHKLDYLALGDSFASGEGAYSYYPYTNNDSNKCHVSTISYPFLINGNGLENVKSIACSGAKTKDVMTTDLEEYITKEPQDRSMLTADFNRFILDNYRPGSRGQLTFVSEYRPKIVTISMIGNDIGFGGIVTRCVGAPDICYPQPRDKLKLVGIINSQYFNAVHMFDQIKRNVAEDGLVYVIGYPQVAKPYGNCAANVGLNNHEIIFANNLISYLNRTIEMAATQAGVRFISTEDAFEGYRMCETESHSVAVNGLDGIDVELFSEWNGVPYLKGLKGLGATSESYHPNQLGHMLYATTIDLKTNGFTLAMPEKKAGNPWIKDEKMEKLLDGEIEYGIINNKYQDDMAADLLFKDIGLDINIDGQENNLAPSSEFNAVLYSEPTQIGSIISNGFGDVTKSLDLPGHLPVGYHTLSLTGSNVLGEQVEFSKIVYVAESPEDFDGDGIKNEDEKCLLVEPAGVDADQDGKDDACDGFIDQPPAPAEPPIDVGDVDTPDVTNNTKDLPPSESRPQWLLDLEADIQASNTQTTAPSQPQGPTVANTPNTAAISTAIVNNASQTTVSGANDAAPNQPETSSATQVRGVENTNTKAATKPAQSNPPTWAPALVIALFTLTISYIIYHKFTTQKKG
jgi:hypothetical protein